MKPGAVPLNNLARMPRGAAPGFTTVSGILKVDYLDGDNQRVLKYTTSNTSAVGVPHDAGELNLTDGSLYLVNATFSAPDASTALTNSTDSTDANLGWTDQFVPSTDLIPARRCQLHQTILCRSGVDKLICNAS